MPPRWFVYTAWKFHRAYFRVTGGRRGLWPPQPGKWGTMRLSVPGRKSGKVRKVILGYYEDGQNYVTLAMNGWGYPEPAWWLNLQAHPDGTLELNRRTLAVRGRPRQGRSANDYGRRGVTTTASLTRTPHSGLVKRPWSYSNRSPRRLAGVSNGRSKRSRPC